MNMQKENHLILTAYLQQSNKNYAYQSILFDNIQKLANFILEKDNKLIEFHIPRIIINKNDSLELRNKILDMTIEERKRLGIGKTTYRYMKKNLTDGRRIKIYDKVLSKLDLKRSNRILTLV